MPLSVTLAYGSLGFGLAMFSNAVRKLPVMRQPWEHVLYFGVGAWTGNRLQEFKESYRHKIAEGYARREKIVQDREERIAARKAAQTS